MGTFRIIPPNHNEGEFYDYVYKITMEHKKKEIIPRKCFTDLIEYFEKVEDYEKCQILFNLIKENEEII